MSETGDGESYAALLSDPRMISVMLLTFVGMTGIQAVPPVLPSMGAALGVADADVGLVMTAFFLPAAVALPLVGMIADLYGRRRVALASLGLFGVAGTAIYAVDSFAAVLVLRGLQGLAFPGLIPLSITLTGDFYTGTAGTTAQGLRISVNGVASTLSPLIAGALAGIGWNVPFLLFLVAVPALAVVFVALPEPETGNEGAEVGVEDYARAVSAELVDRDLAVLMFGALAVFFAQFGVLTFLPLFAVRTLGASSFAAGALVAAYGGTRIVLSPFSGRAVAWLSRKLVVMGAVGFSGASTLVVGAAPGIVVLGALVVAFAAGMSLFNPVLNDAVTSMASDGNRAGVVNVMEVAKTGANAAAPAFFGLVLAAADFGALFAVAGVLLFGYAALVAVLFRGE